ncbi:MAG: hypothetical protein JW829_04475, partial [Pirellulales bacterium]|nr:hypothetical protein [Pirellulales bacterium]
PTVMIGGMPTARLGDLTVHGGVITIGCPTVLIGEVGVGGAGGASPPSGGQGALVGAQAGKAAGHSGSKDTVLAGVKIGKGILAVKDAYNLGVIAGRMLNALSAASKFGQKLLPAAGKAMSRGSKALGPIGIVIGIGLSASEGALEAKPGKRLKGAAKEVGKDVAVMAGGAAVGAAIGAMVGSAAGGVGAVPGAIAGAKIGAAVASVGSAIYDAFNEE